MELRKAEQVEMARRLTKVAAAQKWRWHPDRDDLIHDAEAYAWQYAVAAPVEADPRAIVRFALKRVASDRRFPLSLRDIQHPRNQTTRPRVSFDMDDCHGVAGNPARVVQFNVDFRAWLESLPALHRMVALRFAVGYRPHEVAAEIGRSPARVSQLRDELRTSWQRFLEG